MADGAGTSTNAGAAAKAAKSRYELKWATTDAKGELVPAGTKVELSEKEAKDYPEGILVKVAEKVEQKETPPVNQNKDGSFDDGDPPELKV